MATPEWPARWSRAAAGAVVDLGPRARFSGDLWVAGTAGKTHDKVVTGEAGGRKGEPRNKWDTCFAFHAKMLINKVSG